MLLLSYVTFHSSGKKKKKIILQKNIVRLLHYYSFIKVYLGKDMIKDGYFYTHINTILFIFIKKVT